MTGALGPQAEVDYYQGPQDNKDPAGQIRARGTNQGPRDEPGHRGTDHCLGTDQGPAERIRTREKEQGPRDRDEPGPCKMNQGPAGRIRALLDELVRTTNHGPRASGTDKLTRVPMAPQTFHHLLGGGVEPPVYLGSYWS